jgi:hypothetical protein
MMALLQELAVLSPNAKGFSLKHGLIKYKGCLVIGSNSALQIKLIAALHASAMGGHSGVQATYKCIRSLYLWNGMKVDVETFVQQCSVCQQAKRLHTHPAGLLQPLPPPEAP